MANPSKKRGTAGEVAVVEALREAGWPHAERRALAGVLDRGDVAGVAGVVIEVKNEARYDIPGWLREAAAEKANDGAEVGVVWAKLKGRGNPRDWAVIMTGQQFLDLLKAAGYQ